jgi:hypothetical protein
MHVKMNTPGQADEIIEGKVDGVLSYRKTNMIFRLPGHDSLHVRTVWLDVFKGGGVGNLNDQQVYLDQLVVALKDWVGPWAKSPIPASTPTSPQAPTGKRGVLPNSTKETRSISAPPTGSYKQKLWMKRKGDVPFWGCVGGQPQDPG